MNQEQNSSWATGCVLAAVAVVLLVVCGGGALLLAGSLIFARLATEAGYPPVPQAAKGHADVLAVEADGTLLWNDEPLARPELKRRLSELKNAPGPPRSVILRVSPNAPPGASDEATQLLSDHSVDYILEDAN